MPTWRGREIESRQDRGSFKRRKKRFFLVVSHNQNVVARQQSNFFVETRLVTSLIQVCRYLCPEVRDLVLQLADFVGLVHRGRQITLSHLLLVLESIL
jgi:hypothetical protein